LAPEEDPDLVAHQRRDFIHTDETTLLEADDKAGIVEIVRDGGIYPHPPLEWIASTACMRWTWPFRIA
jgi:hypothetical protein